MSLLVTPFPDIKSLLGPSWRKTKFQLHPGSPSDYPTGGYPITANQCEMGFLSGFTINGTNAAGLVYQAKAVFPASSFGATAAPATSINLVVTQSDTQVAANTDLSGVYFIAEADGW
jgi:hypothetical protein